MKVVHSLRGTALTATLVLVVLAGGAHAQPACDCPGLSPLFAWTYFQGWTIRPFPWSYPGWSADVTSWAGLILDPDVRTGPSASTNVGLYAQLSFAVPSSTANNLYSQGCYVRVRMDVRNGAGTIVQTSTTDVLGRPRGIGQGVNSSSGCSINTIGTTWPSPGSVCATIIIEGPGGATECPSSCKSIA